MLIHEQDSFFDLQPSARVAVDGIPYIVSKLARGGMGFVLLLHKDTENAPSIPTAFGLKLALKAMLPDSTDSEGIRLFKRELTVWAPFRHPNIVSLLDILDGGDAGWVAAMDWCPGSLRDILNERGKLPLKEATLIIGNIIEGLNYAYDRDKILHLDLKPENILYDIDISRLMENCSTSNDTLHMTRFMLADWGIASIKQRELNAIAGLPPSSDSIAKTLNNMGTLKYMSPERFHKGFSSSIASDMFSLGMIYLEMLTGHLPFQNSINPVLNLKSGQYLTVANALLSNAKVPKSICEIIRFLIAFRLQDRPSDYNVLQSHLIRAYRKSHGFFSIFT